MHYLVYKITNCLNEKIYIGAHKTNNVDDDYMGSGIGIKRAYKKYGISNFEKIILFDFQSEEEMYDKEAELVTEDFIKLSNNYNSKPGGKGGGNLSSNRWINNGKENTYLNANDNVPDGWFLGLVKSNKKFIYINNEIKNKKIESSEPIPIGWKKGRHVNSTEGTKGMFPITNGSEQIFVRDYNNIPKGWKRGSLPRVWINNGFKNKRILLKETIPDGYALGTVKTCRKY